jgi:hypothetical protein
VFFGLVTTGWIIELVAGTGGEDALPYTWADLLATTALWLTGLAALLLLFSQTASPYYLQEPAHQ